LYELTVKYFKTEDSDQTPPPPPASDSQDVIKNLLTTFFPKNKQLNKKVLVQNSSKVNGVWVMNKPPGQVIIKEKENEKGEMIPLSIKVEFDDFSFEETILWDSLKNEMQDILIFSFLYLQDLMKEKEKYDVEKKDLESKLKIILKHFFKDSLIIIKKV